MKNSLFTLLLVLLASYGNAQTFEWAQRIGGSANEYPYSMALDDSENVYITGSFSGSVDFDPGAGTFSMTSFGSSDIFILKLNSSGGFVWARQIGSGTGSNSGQSIVCDINRNVYVTGGYFGSPDFDPGPGVFYMTSINSADIFVLKLNSSGNFQWAKSLGGSGNGVGKRVQLDKAANIFLSGTFTGVTDFDPGPGIYNLTSPGSNGNLFFVKLTSAGDFVWAERIGNGSTIYLNDMKLDSSAHIYGVGYFYGTW